MEGVDYGEGTKSYMERPPDFRQTLLPTRTIQRGHRTVAKWDPDFVRHRYGGGETNQSSKSAAHTSRRRVNLNQILASSKGSDAN